MNTHDKLELPPLPDLPAYSPEVFDREVKVVSETMAEQLMQAYARAAIEADRKRGTAKQRYDSAMEGSTESDPIERLRFYCSLAMSDQDWLDVEGFFDKVVDDRQRRGEPVAWIYEDDLPKGYPYDEMYPFSKVDGVRMFPVFWPETVLTPGYLEGHRDGLEWAARLAEANHPLTGDWLYDDPHDLAKAIRKGPEMPPAEPQPAEPVKEPKGALRDFLDAAKRAGIERLDLAHIYDEPVNAGRVGEMTHKRAAFFLERFKREEKLLGPNEQWALEYAIEVLEAEPVKSTRPDGSIDANGFFAQLEAEKPAEPTANVHIDDDAVDHFAAAMKEKLAQARAKGRHGWHECDPADLSAMLRDHVEKGDPLDVANFCMFLWSLGNPISAALPSVPDILFDGWAVLQAIDHKARERTLAIHVSDVLDAVVRLLGSTPPADGQAQQEGKW